MRLPADTSFCALQELFDGVVDRPRTTRVMAIVLKMSAAVAIHTIGRWIPTASVLTQSSRSSVISSTMTASGTPTPTAQNTVMRW